ncbi:MAG TPA: VanZ family protein [Vicinamibacterales bacterium]|nr:VanZ family protein [Vicinamibacterales bacterium]
MKKLLYLWLLGWALFGFPWTSFTTTPRFSKSSLVPLRTTRRRDQLLNFFYYVPFGVIGILSGWSLSLTAATAFALSAVTELVQIFSTSRYPSSTDLLLNTAGAIVGIAVTTVVFSRSRI